MEKEKESLMFWKIKKIPRKKKPPFPEDVSLWGKGRPARKIKGGTFRRR